MGHKHFESCNKGFFCVCVSHKQRAWSGESEPRSEGKNIWKGGTAAWVFICIVLRAGGSAVAVVTEMVAGYGGYQRNVQPIPIYCLIPLCVCV